MPKDNPENYPKRKLQEHNGSYTLVLPKSLCQAKGWRQGTEFTIKLNEKGNLEIFSK